MVQNSSMKIEQWPGSNYQSRQRRLPELTSTTPLEEKAKIAELFRQQELIFQLADGLINKTIPSQTESGDYYFKASKRTPAVDINNMASYNFNCQVVVSSQELSCYFVMISTGTNGNGNIENTLSVPGVNTDITVFSQKSENNLSLRNFIYSSQKGGERYSPSGIFLSIPTNRNKDPHLYGQELVRKGFPTYSKLPNSIEMSSSLNEIVEYIRSGSFTPKRVTFSLRNHEL